METIKTEAKTARERLDELATNVNVNISHFSAFSDEENFSEIVGSPCKVYPDGFEGKLTRYADSYFLYIEDSFGRPKAVYYQVFKTPDKPVVVKDKQ